MCGIAGVLAAGEGAEEIARRMHARLAHRGPDGEAVACAGSAVLAHRRLSIIDLSAAGAQPMWDASRRVAIAYNGEIYNYRELREECVRRGATFLSATDTEVVLNLFLLDGERAFARLNGMFAFALVDTGSGDAWLVRDPAGIKPLYFAPTSRGVVFASELGALLAGGALPFEIDQAALQAYAQHDFVPSPMAMVRGVEKLPGGSLAHIGPDGALARRVYSRVMQESFPAGATPEADVDRFDAAIRAAVSRQLVADVPVGVFLSGGIDSSVVARVAADAAGAISTFSIAFDDPSFDESRYFDLAARAVGSDHHTERLTAAAMLDLVPGIAATASEPLADGSIFPTLLLSRFARRHVKVALSGDGADELFGGYPTHQMIGAGRMYGALPGVARRGIAAAADRLLPVSHANLSLDFRIRKFLDGADRDPVVQNEQWLGSFRADELPRLLTRFDAEAQRTLVAQWHEASAGATERLERVLRTDRRFYLEDGVLVKADRASMSASLEVRVPMLDHDVVRFANGLPADRKLRGGTTKWVLREWARRHFPEEIWRRPKKGFGAPLGQWFRGELRGLVRDTLAPAGIARDGFFLPGAVTALLDSHESGRRDERKRIFNVLMFTLWYRMYR